MISDRLNLFLVRKEPSIFKDLKLQEDFIVCDYCKEKIILYKQRTKRTGGIVILPDSLTNKGNVHIALCNKCLKNTLKEFKNH